VDDEYFKNIFEVKDRKRKRSQSKTARQVKTLLVLDHKRTNAICIAMKKLPPLSQLREAITVMDEALIDREGVDKLQQLLPTLEELKLIADHQDLNKELPLGDAEQFLQILGSISNIDARLKLWAFKSDFKTMEKEIYEPLKDLKLGMDELQENKTFHTILSVTLAIGNILNKKESKGFQLDYLSKLSEVKDTAQRKSLMYHITFKVLETFPECSDFYSDIDPVIRASRTNYSELVADLGTMTEQCKTAREYVKDQDKAGTDTEHIVQSFLKDASLRIDGLKKIEKKIMKRFTKFLMWLGIPSHLHTEYPPHVVAKIITDLALQFKIHLTQIKQSEERLKTVKTRKIQRRSAPNLKFPSDDVQARKSIRSDLTDTDLEGFLVSAAREGASRGKVRENYSMWNSR